jgi:hypothetical protein
MLRVLMHERNNIKDIDTRPFVLSLSKDSDRGCQELAD